ncbi:hypothetical protein PS710_00274 [Pseudomonas fluorescens]|uniref:Ppx/GppA phosphatase N-terminal domain-containing protein n=1 Tax=Pseudomonas fluorescens TaxID=294 RepID=A0A5E6ZQL7_PSEFL|nr:hypothetical protein PS710_00274 [Pseudomonas fluorescens]
MLAKNPKTLRGVRLVAISLTTFASKLAPTGIGGVHAIVFTPNSDSRLLRLSLRLLEVGHVKKLRLAGLQAHRLSILPGGLVLMLAAFKVFGITQMTPSEPGLRLGVLHGLMSSH